MDKLLNAIINAPKKHVPELDQSVIYPLWAKDILPEFAVIRSMRDRGYSWNEIDSIFIEE